MAARTDKLRHPLASFGAVPLPREALDEVLAGYRRPNDKISEWLKDGALQPMRRGLYLTGPALRGGPACLPLVANHLYGPSYVSLDFALAMHGLIPEGVAEIASVTTKGSRRFNNALGRFSYRHLPLAYYRNGQSLGQSAEGFGYLIATPTKALCDRLVLSPQLQRLSRADMRVWLIEDLRLDTDLLGLLMVSEVEEYMQAGFKRRELGTLKAVIEALREESG